MKEKQVYRKKILAVVCAVVLALNAMGIQSWAEASTSTASMTELTFSDFGLANQTYTFVRGTYKEGASLIGTKVSGYITLNEDLTNASAGAWLVLGGTTGLESSGWDGIQIQFDPSGKSVTINQGPVGTNGYPFTYSVDSNRGLTTFAGTKFKLAISLESANLDGGVQENDVLFKLYINDHLWVANNVTDAATYGKDGSYYILNAKTENLLGYLAAQQIGAAGLCSDMAMESYTETLTPISFTDFGLANDTYNFVRGTYKEGASLVGKKLSGYITLNEDLKEASAGAWLVLGGTAGQPSSGWDGIQIQFEPDGKTVKVNQGSVGTNGYPFTFSVDNNRGLTTFAGEKFKLTISLESANLDGETEANDVLFKLYINDNLWVANDTGNAALYGADGSYYILNAKTGNFLGYLAAQQIGAEGLCADVTFESISTGTQTPEPGPEPEPEPKPEEPVVLTDLDFTNFGLADGTYTFVRGTYNEGASLIGTKFSDYITLNEDLTSASAGTWLVLGGTTGLASSGWDGVQIQFEPDGKTVKVNQGSVTATNPYAYTFSADSNEGLTTFAGEKFKLTISFEPANLDGGTEKNDILVKLYVNDQLWVANDTGNANLYGADGSYSILNAKTENMLGYLAVQQMGVEGLCSDITLGEVNAEPGPEEPGPEAPEELTELSFIDFELADNRYTNVRGTYKDGESLVGKEISGYLTFNENMISASSDIYVVLGGTDGLESSGWDGVQLQFKTDGKTVILNQGSVTTSNPYPFTYCVDNNQGITTFAGEKFKLTISFESANLDSGTEKDDVIVKLYINDELWVANDTGNGALYGEQGSYYILNANTGNLQGYFTVQNIGVDGMCSDVVMESLDGRGKEEIVKPALHKVTLGQLGITEALYKYNSNNLVVSGEYKDGLMNSTFSTKIEFSKHSGSSIRYGGRPSAWHGINFTVQDNGAIQIQASAEEFSEVYYLMPEVAGTTLVGEEIDLKIELFKSEKHAKLGVYVNGELYDGAYFHLSNAADAFGNYVGFYVENKQGSIKIGVPEPTPVANQHFEQLTFDSYGIETSTYRFDKLGLSAIGHCSLKDLNKVVFSDTVQFSKAAGAQIRIGGKPSAWHGLILANTEDGKLVLTEAEGRMSPIYFDSATAGTALVGTDVKLQLSFEYVDADGDGKKDDVKLGVWFNGIAYGDRWVYLQDIAEVLGGYLGIYCSNQDAFMKIYTYHVPIDYTIWGFTRRWAYELGLRK